jgi:hypothetical protein
VEPGELDLDRFKALSSEAGQAMSAGDPPAAASALRDSLELFRGAPLFGKRLGCIVNESHGSGADLAALCEDSPREARGPGALTPG